MKYKDYYAALGISRDASAADIKKAYRKLAQKHHPDVSKEAGAEDRFKDIAEAYATLKDPEKRAAYDRLGTHAPGQDFQPPPDWGGQFGEQFGDRGFRFEDIDLSDLFAGLGARAGGPRGGGGHGLSMPGEDFEVTARIPLEDAATGTLVELNLSVPEYDANGRLARTPRVFKARIPKGATNGQRLRLRGKGGKGFNGGRDGDLYLNIELAPHALFRPAGHDLYIDLPLAPWEAALGATVAVPTLAGSVHLKVPAGTMAGQKLRLSKRGLPRPEGDPGDLFAIAQIVVPPNLTERERELLSELASSSKFDPRSHFNLEAAHAN
jgi:curved DNA-binding protein